MTGVQTCALPICQWFAGAAVEEGIQIGDVVTFNAPGISQTGADTFNTAVAGDPSLVGDVNHYIANGDVVSMAGEAFIDGAYSIYWWDKPWDGFSVGSSLNVVGMAIDLKDTILEAHLNPILFEGDIRGRGWDDGTYRTVFNPSVDSLNASSFVFEGAGYREALLGATYVAKVAAIANPGLDLSWVPSLLTSRATTEGSRQFVGRTVDALLNRWTQLESIPSVFDLVNLASLDLTASDSLTTYGDSLKLRYEGDLDLGIGGDTTVELPGWAGGEQSVDFFVDLVNTDTNAVFTSDSVTADGTYEVFGGLFEATGTANLDLSKGQMLLTGDVDLLDGLASGSGSLQVASDLSFVIRGADSVNLPQSSPVWPGASIAGGEFLVSFSNDGNLANDYIAVWGNLGPLELGLRLWMAPSVQNPLGWDVLGGREIDELDGQNLSGVAAGLIEENAIQPFASGQSVQEASFSISNGTEWALFSGRSAGIVTEADISLVSPTGQVFDETAIDADPDMEFVSELGGELTRSVRVDSPVAGTWQIVVTQGTNAVPVDFRAMVDAPKPTLNLTGISHSPTSETASIDFEAFDADSQAKIDFFYDTDNSGFDGVLFRQDVSETDGSGSISWDTSSMPAGEYYVYATITDESNVPQSTYLPGDTITIERNAAPLAAIEAIAPRVLDWTDGESIRFTAGGRDVDGEIVGWEWFVGQPVDYDGNSVATTQSFELAADWYDVGSYDISLRVQDDDGAWSGWVTEPFTIADAKPFVEGITLSPSQPMPEDDTVRAGGELDIQAFGQDADEWGAAIEQMRVQLDGETYTVNYGPWDGIVVVNAPDAPGQYTVTVTLQDDEGTWSEPAEKVLTVVPSAAPEIDVGDVVVLQGQSEQIVEIFVTGGAPVQGLNFNAQITNPDNLTNVPVIKDVDILSGTIFDGNNTGTADLDGPHPDTEPQFEGRNTTTSSGTVEGEGLLATLTIDASEASEGTFALVLSDTDNGPTEFPGDRVTITDGTIEVVAGLASVVDRHVFYNGSSFDARDSSANAADDGAIATDKSAMLPGETASSANFTSYNRGLNGVMIDVSGLAAPGLIDASDFVLTKGNDDTPSDWTPVSASIDVSVREGAGVDGSDRITLILPDGEVVGAWLRVEMLANLDTGLSEPDVFYFGNAPADGNGDGISDTTDVDLARANQTGFGTADISNPYDYNSDGRVNLSDVIQARNLAAAGHAIHMLSLPVPVFEADFVADGTPSLDGFTIDNTIGASADGLWALTDARASDAGHSAPYSLYFGAGEGAGGGGNYDVGHTAGHVTSPLLTVPTGSPVLMFSYFAEMEGLAGSTWFEQPIVEVSANGQPFYTLADAESGALQADTGGQWVAASIDLTPYAGASAQFRFVFDSLDGLVNNFEGWFIDDVIIAGRGQSVSTAGSTVATMGGAASPGMQMDAANTRQVPRQQDKVHAPANKAYEDMALVHGQDPTQIEQSTEGDAASTTAVDLWWARQKYEAYAGLFETRDLSDRTSRFALDDEDDAAEADGFLWGVEEWAVSAYPLPGDVAV